MLLNDRIEHKLDLKKKNPQLSIFQSVILIFFLRFFSSWCSWDSGCIILHSFTFSICPFNGISMTFFHNPIPCGPFPVFSFIWRVWSEVPCEIRFIREWHMNDACIETWVVGVHWRNTLSQVIIVVSLSAYSTFRLIFFISMLSQLVYVKILLVQVFFVTQITLEAALLNKRDDKCETMESGTKDNPQTICLLQCCNLTLKVLVTTIDALGHFWTGQLQCSGTGWGM